MKRRIHEIEFGREMTRKVEGDWGMQVAKDVLSFLLVIPLSPAHLDSS